MPGIYDQDILANLQGKGLLTAERTGQVWQQAETENRNVEDILVERGWVNEEDLTKSKSEVYHIAYADLAGRAVPPEVLNIIPEDTANNYKMVAYEKVGDELKIGLVDPLNLKAIEAAEFIAKKNNFRSSYSIISPTNFNAVFRRYKALGEEVEKVLGAAEEKFKPEEAIAEGLKGEELEKVIKAAPVSKIVSTIIKHAIDSKASDIHIEPSPEGTKVRYRIDGLLRISLTLPSYLHSPIVSRIKVLANLKLDETRRPQDGRIRMIFAKEKVDLRVSTLPLVDTEKVALRVLDTSGIVLTLEQLGFRPKYVKLINQSIRRPFGLFLVTGPTGAGKSTTLYSALNVLNAESVNIVTLEDPAEFFIPGMNQSQVNPEVGYTFASGLRAILRQDPDILMVGEIRDSETGELAVHAALTGHIVFATLHTNDALGAIPRLMDLKVEPFLISSVISGVMAQRLVRKICDDCRQPVTVPADLDRQIKMELQALVPQDQPKVDWNQPLIFYQGQGCNKCGHTGYRGRTPIAEVLIATDNLKKIINAHFPPDQIKEETRLQGMISMRQDGFLKALEGVTTVAEVLRVMQE